MQRMMISIVVFGLLVSSRGAVAQSNIDPVHKHAWGENIGWTNWRDANYAVDGIFVDVENGYLSGYVWGENVGWLNVGDGNGPYANTTNEDFGVNIDPDGDLSGYAWGENIGWVNFDTGSAAPDQARYDAETGRFRGYAWGENVGWINLEDAEHFVKRAANPPMACPDYPETFMMNRCLNFRPNNDMIVAFRANLTGLLDQDCFANGPCAQTGEWWLTTPVCRDKNGIDTGAVPGLDNCAYPDIWHSGLVSDPALAYLGVWPDDCCYVCDCEVVPLGDYELRATDDPVGGTLSAPLVRSTQRKPGAKCWGDCIGSWTGTQWSAPNGVVGMDDIMAAVFCFQNAANAPHRMWVEMAAEEPDMVLTFTDILFLVQAFKGEPYPYACPEDCPAGSARGGGESDAEDVNGPGPKRPIGPADRPIVSADYLRESASPAAVSVGSATMILRAERTSLLPGESLAVEVDVRGARSLAAYEVALDVSSGDPGKGGGARKVASPLVLKDLFVDTGRDDFVFGAVESIQAVDDVGGRLGGVVLTEAAGPGETVYLGTFVFRANSDAPQTFYVRLREGGGTFLRDGLAELIPFEVGPEVMITVGPPAGGRPTEPRDW